MSTKGKCFSRTQTQEIPPSHGDDIALAEGRVHAEFRDLVLQSFSLGTYCPWALRMKSVSQYRAKAQVLPLPVDPFSIHEDNDAESESSGSNDIENERVEAEQLDSEESSEYESDDSNGEVDVSVAEDMLKLENTFEGISRRFRLINRIGEGTTYPAIPSIFLARACS